MTSKLQTLPNSTPVIKKTRLLIVLFLLFTSLALKIASMDIYIPCMPFLKSYFKVEEWVIQFSLMLSPLMSSLTALFYGRWADVHGRRITTLTALGIFVVGSAGCALSTHISTFLIFRVIQSAGAGGLGILTLVILSDLFKGISYARYVATYNTMFPVTFAIAPVAGAQLFEWFNWQVNFWLLAVIGLGVFIAVYWLIDETLQKTNNQIESWSKIAFKTLSLFTNYYFTTMSIGHCLSIVVVCIYTANSAFLFIDHLNFSAIDFSYIQLIPVAMNFLGAVTYRQLLPKLGLEKSLKIGMCMTFLFILGAAFCLFLTPVWLVCSILATICLLNFGLPFCNSTCATWAYESATGDKGLAIALVALMRNALISGFVMFTAFFQNGTIAPTFVVMICLSLFTLLVLRKGLSLTKGVPV